MEKVNEQIAQVQAANPNQLMTIARDLRAPYDLVTYVHEHGKLPVINFAAGGVSTPADAALMMNLGADGVFVGSGIFHSENPEKFAKAIVAATAHPTDYALIAEVSKNIGKPMKGIEIAMLSEDQKMASRGI